MAATFLLIAYSLQLLMISKVTSQEELETLSSYSTYKLIEDAIVHDPEQLFKMREAFFPAINDRYWQVDGVDVIPIKMCVTLDNSLLLPQCEGGETNRMVNATSQCWPFHWTNSRLLNLISGETLLAMDAVTTRYMYPEIVGSSSLRKLLLNVSLKVNTTSLRCLPSSGMVEEAITHFLSWAKLYAMESTPTKWDSRYQGYIAKRYTYYSTDSYFNRLSRGRSNILLIQRFLLATFTSINILIPTLIVTRGRQLVNWAMPIIIKNNHMHRATTLTITIFNFIFIIDTFYVLFGSRHRNVLDCYIATSRHPCDIPRKANFYNIAISILLTKVVILPIALLTELIAAVYITMKDVSTWQLLCKTVLNTKAFCSCFLQAFALWQVFMFVQIIAGSVSIPFIILFIISPALTILLAGEMTVLLILITTFFVSIPLPKSCSCNSKSCVKPCFFYTETLLIIVLTCTASAAYYFIVKNGMNMGGVKGYIMSLIPTIPISIFIWIIKRKLLGERLKKKKRELTAVLVQRRDSFSTEEEMIDFSEDSADDI